MARAISRRFRVEPLQLITSGAEPDPSRSGRVAGGPHTGPATARKDRPNRWLPLAPGLQTDVLFTEA